MILPDISLLIHAHNADSPVHDAARRWWDDLLGGTVGAGLAWVVVLGFIRITTHRGILVNPLAVTEVLDRLVAANGYTESMTAQDGPPCRL